jgi:transposase InsO family protein
MRTDAEGARRNTVGWEYVHIAIDDATRLAYVEVLTDEKATTAVAFLARAVTHFASYGIRVERLITDKGSAYRSTIHAIACRSLGIRHLRPRPYRPQTNGKAERFMMGHHSAAFTLDNYGHLFDDGLGPSLDLSERLPAPAVAEGQPVA